MPAHDPAPFSPLPRWLLVLLALTAGITVANIYYCQPLLGVMAGAFGVGTGAVTAVAASTQLGYATGLLLIAPLADSLERKTLIVVTTAISASVLAGVALCPTVRWLTVASYVLGAASVTPQLVVPYAAGMAPPERRGRTVGAVMSGLLVGILLSRTLSGLVAAHAGWRMVYWLACGVMLVLAGVLAILLPVQRPARRIAYCELLASLPPLLAREPVLRRHALIGALGFGAFSAFWTTLSFHLASLPGHYGSETAGLFGLIGAAGALAAIVSGRLADRIGPKPLNGAALGLAAASFALMAVAGRSLAGLAAGVIGMDAGIQGSQISNQARIYALPADLRNRINSVYMVCYFLGGALGSTLGARAWTAAGWSGVCAAGGLLCVGGVVALFTVGQAPAPAPAASR